MNSTRATERLSHGIENCYFLSRPPGVVSPETAPAHRLTSAMGTGRQRFRRTDHGTMEPSLLNDLSHIFSQLVLPLLRLCGFIALGLFVANVIESLNWTDRLALVVRPLLRAGRLSATTGASFSMAFVSGVSANTLLSEAFDQGRMTRRELFLANLFNAIPRFFLHLPTVFFLTAPMIKMGAVYYVALTLTASLLQTVLVVIGGRWLLDPQTVAGEVPAVARRNIGFSAAMQKGLQRLKKRLGKVLLFMVPVYLLFYFLNHHGVFAQLERFLADHVGFLSWLNPKSLGIIVFMVTTEFSAGLAAASALLAADSLTVQEVVLALLVGNILATPIRTVRHQLPYYSGIYAPRLALQLVVAGQVVRTLCVAIVACGWYFFA